MSFEALFLFRDGKMANRRSRKTRPQPTNVPATAIPATAPADRAECFLLPVDELLVWFAVDVAEESATEVGFRVDALLGDSVFDDVALEAEVVVAADTAETRFA